VNLFVSGAVLAGSGDILSGDLFSSALNLAGNGQQRLQLIRNFRRLEIHLDMVD
jgi:hypothetical protein